MAKLPAPRDPAHPLGSEELPGLRRLPAGVVSSLHLGPRGHQVARTVVAHSGVARTMPTPLVLLAVPVVPVITITLCVAVTVTVSTPVSMTVTMTIP